MPAEERMTTVPPLDVSRFPLASRNCTVTVEVDTPSATTVVGDAEIVEVAVDAAPGKNSTVAESVALTPPTVNVISAAPTEVVDVRTAV